MKELNFKKIVADMMYKTAANNANRTSCVIMHQPKAPEELKNLKKIK